MEKISEMIERLCPEGVSHVRLDSICTFQRGKTITAKDAINGDIPVIAGGQTPSYYHNEANRFGESVTIAGSGAYAGFVSYWDTPIYVSDAFTVKPQDCLLHKYLYHYLKQNQQKIFDTQKGAGVPHVHGKDIAGFEIPLPPLPIQQEIVRILDSFTQLQSNLEAELASRQKQYEYYRNKLLTFDKDDESVEWKTLGALGHSFTGLTGKTKKDFENGNSVFVTYSNIFNNPELNMDISERVMIFDGEHQNIIQEGDILFTGSSETPDEAGMSSVVLKKTNSNMYLNSFCFGLRLDNFDLVRPSYMKYVLRSQGIRKKISQTAFGVTRYNINKDKFFKVEIPIPSLSRQQEIVSILDTFESLTTNLKLEIELRKKQYEYYREQLLTFE